MTVARYYECTKYNWILHFKMVNCILCEFLFNKLFFKEYGRKCFPQINLRYITKRNQIYKYINKYIPSMTDELKNKITGCHYRFIQLRIQRKEIQPWLGDSVGCHPIEVASSIPGEGTCLGCGPGPQSGAWEKQPHIDVSLPLFFPPFPSVKK